MSTTSVKISFNHHVVELPHERVRKAIFYGQTDGIVVASCTVDPWPALGEVVRPFVAGFNVAGGFRGRGVGTGLLRDVIHNAELRRVPSLAMWVRSTNVDAQRFYRRHGFEAFHEDEPNLFFGRTLGPPVSPAARDRRADVMEFHERTDSYVGRRGPAVPDAGTVDFRMGLVREEVERELYGAMDRGDLPAIADAVVDAQYVLEGLAISYGIDTRPIWAAVHAANMAKAGAGRRADGKQLKPPGWTPPDVAGLIADQQRAAAVAAAEVPTC